jgi:hypothetical protein
VKVGVRIPGGARGSGGNWHTSRAQNLAACAFDSRLPYSMPFRSNGRTVASGVTDRGSNPRGAALPPRTACGFAFVRRMTRFDPGWRLSSARAATGRRARLRVVLMRVRSPSFAPCDRSVSGKHVTLPWLQGRFESGRSLSSRTSPTAEAPGLGPGGSRFESEVRHGR